MAARRNFPRREPKKQRKGNKQSNPIDQRRTQIHKDLAKLEASLKSTKGAAGSRAVRAQMGLLKNELRRLNRMHNQDRKRG